MTGDPAAWRRSLARVLSRYRRLLAAAFAAAAVALGLAAVRPPAPEGMQILVAVRDLSGGTALRGGDVAVRTLPAAAVPDGVLRPPGAQVTGRMLAGPMRRGEPFTDARLLSAGLLSGQGTGVVAAPVRIADAGVVRLLHAGDRVDVLAARTGTGADDADRPAEPPLSEAARVVASAVSVVAVPRGPAGVGADEGALVVLATSREQAAALARAAVGGRLSLTIVSAGSS